MSAAAISETWTPDDVETWAQGEDLSAARGKLVELSSTMGQVTLCNGATDKVYGVVVTESTASTTGLPVGILPIGSGKCCKVLSSGVIAIGARVGTTNAGLAVTKSSNQDYTIGLCLETAALNELVTVALRFGQRAA
jgi:hypothetical protein